MFKYTKNIFITLVLMMVFVVPFVIQAADVTVPPRGPDVTVPPTPATIKIVNPFKESTIEGFIRAVVNDILIPIGAVVATLMIMYAGFLFVTARGNEAKVTEAKKALLWAVIGAAILLGAWVISEAIGSTIKDLKK